MGELVEYASKYGKTDIERLGLFIEMQYMHGKKYVSPFPKPPPIGGRNLYSGGPKSKCGTQHGYFDEEFRRLFEGEAISKGLKRKKKKQELTKWRPAGPSKKHCGTGDFFGTFGGPLEAFSRVARKERKKGKEPRNLMTNPMKKGGPGYVDICLNKYPEHLADPYKAKSKKQKQKLGKNLVLGHYTEDFFQRNPYRDEDHEFGPTYKIPKKSGTKKGFVGSKWIPTGPSKWQGGCHAGLFSKHPEWMTERGKVSKKTKVPKELFGRFGPQSMAMKTMFTKSTLNYCTDLCVNVKNYKRYEPKFIKYWNR